MYNKVGTGYIIGMYVQQGGTGYIVGMYVQQGGTGYIVGMYVQQGRNMIYCRYVCTTREEQDIL
jgi:hypothetical protein